MDIETLKGKTLDDKLHADLVAHVTGLKSAAETADDKARKAAKESIDGRKTLKAERDAAFEKLGVSSLDELEALPDAKGQADAVKQFEAKLKKAERELADKSKALDELGTKFSSERRERAIAQAAAKHPFIDADDARMLIGARVRQEGDEFMFEGEGGKLVPIDDGAAWLAKTKTHLVKPAGGSAGGSGFKGNQGSAQANPWAAKTFNVTEQVRLKQADPALAERLKADAQQQA
jgi:hypothetical protein